MSDPAVPALFSCEKLSARLTVKACGARFLAVRSTNKGGAGYDSACDKCPIGAHHAKTGTLFTGMEVTEPMQSPQIKYTDEQQKEATRRVLVGNETRAAVAKDIGVTATSITNWINRWRGEVSREAVPVPAGAAAKIPKTPDESHLERAVREAQSTPSVEDVVEHAKAGADPLTGLWRLIQQARGDVDVRSDLARLGADLGRAVCHVGEKHVRDSVADAAWILTQAAKG